MIALGQTYDVSTFFETASRILHNFKEDKVSRNALLLLNFSRIILIFPSALKSYPYFLIYGQIADFLHIRTNTDQRKPMFDIFHAVFNMISVEYRRLSNDYAY